MRIPGESGLAILAAAAVVVAAGAQLPPAAISDLPPAIHSQQIPAVDVFIESSRADDTILRVCKQFAATCAVSGTSPRRVGYVCTGEALVCWRRFVDALRQGGIKVLALPARGGGSFTFILDGAGAPGDAVGSAAVEDGDGDGAAAGVDTDG